MPNSIKYSNSSFAAVNFSGVSRRGLLITGGPFVSTFDECLELGVGAWCGANAIDGECSGSVNESIICHIDQQIVLAQKI